MARSALSKSDANPCPHEEISQVQEEGRKKDIVQSSTHDKEARNTCCYLLIQEANNLGKVEGKAPNPYVIVRSAKQKVRFKGKSYILFSETNSDIHSTLERREAKGSRDRWCSLVQKKTAYAETRTRNPILGLRKKMQPCIDIHGCPQCPG
jgi:hypothetical protein